MGDLAIRVDGLGKQYRIGGAQTTSRDFRDVVIGTMTAPLRRVGKLLRGQAYGAANLDQTFWALKDVSFEVKKGEVVGIIGRNGAGKSTLLKILSRITDPTEGAIDLYGRVGSLLEVGTGFHAELTGRENVYLNGAILGMTRAEIDRKFDEIVDFAGVEKFIDTPVKHYSSGMALRLGFSVAAHLEPEILVVDEVLAVGDAEFQKKCLGKMGDVAGEGRTVLFVSHNMGAVQNLCTRGILLQAGQAVLNDAISRVIDQYMSSNVKPTGEVDLANLERYGSPTRDLEFTQIQLLQTNKTSGGYIDSGNGVTVQVGYRVSKQILGGQIGLRLWNKDGVCVLTSTNFEANPTASDEIVEPGDYTATCFIPPEYLRLGNYRIDLGASIPNRTLLDEIRDCIAFEVVLDSKPDITISQSRLGVVAPNLIWHITPIN